MRQVVADVVTPHETGDRGDKRSALPGDMACNVFSISLVTRPDCDMQILALAIEGSACQRQPVFPAVESADGKWPELVCPQPVAVAYCPDETFFMGWHEFAVHRANQARGIDVNHRAVQAVAATIACSFHDAQVHSDLVPGGGCADDIEVTVLDRYTLIDVVSVEGFLQAGFELRTLGAFNPERVAGYERLAEDDQLGAFFRAPGDPVDKLRQGRITLEPDRCDLAQRDSERLS